MTIRGLLCVSAITASVLVGCQSPKLADNSFSDQLPKLSQPDSLLNFPSAQKESGRPVAAANYQDALPDFGKGVQQASGSAPQTASRPSAANTAPAGTPPNVAALLTQAGVALTERNLSQARTLYQDVLKFDPVNPVANHRLGVIADMNNDFGAAEEHYRRAMHITPHNADLLSDLGYSYKLQNRMDDAKKFLLRAIEVNPSHNRAINNLGALLAEEGDYAGAKEWFAKTGTAEEASEKLAIFFPNGVPTVAAVTAAAMVPAPRPALPTPAIAPPAQQQTFEQMQQAMMESRRQAEVQAARVTAQANGAVQDVSTAAMQRIQVAESELAAQLGNPRTMAAPSMPNQLPARLASSTQPAMPPMPSFGTQQQPAQGPAPQVPVAAANPQVPTGQPWAARGQMKAMPQHSQHGINTNQQAQLAGMNAGPGGLFPVQRPAPGTNIQQPMAPPITPPAAMMQQQPQMPGSVPPARASYGAPPAANYGAPPAGYIQQLPAPVPVMGSGPAPHYQTQMPVNSGQPAFPSIPGPAGMQNQLPQYAPPMNQMPSNVQAVYPPSGGALPQYPAGQTSPPAANYGTSPMPLPQPAGASTGAAGTEPPAWPGLRQLQGQAQTQLNNGIGQAAQNLQKTQGALNQFYQQQKSALNDMTGHAMQSVTSQLPVVNAK